MYIWYLIYNPRYILKPFILVSSLKFCLVQNPQAMLVSQMMTQKQILGHWLDFCHCTAVLESDAALGNIHTVPRCAQVASGLSTAGKDAGCHQKATLNLCGGCTGSRGITSVRGVPWTRRINHQFKQNSHPSNDFKGCSWEWLLQVANLEGDWGRFISKPLL